MASVSLLLASYIVSQLMVNSVKIIAEHFSVRQTFFIYPCVCNGSAWCVWARHMSDTTKEYYSWQGDNSKPFVCILW